MKKRELFLHTIYWFAIYSYTYMLIEYFRVIEDYMYPYIICLCLYLLATAFAFTTSALLHKLFKYSKFKSVNAMKYSYQRKQRRKRINKKNKLKK